MLCHLTLIHSAVWSARRVTETATSTPQQIAKAIIDMRETVENVIRNAYVQDYLVGSDEMDPARDFVFSMFAAKFTEAQLRSVKDLHP